MFVLLLCLGIITGFGTGFFGIGGGSVIVPLLMFFGISIKQAVGISVMQMVFSSVFGSYLNHKRGLLKLSNGLYLGLGGFFGGFLSGFIVKHIADWLLVVIFALMLLFCIYRFFSTPLKSDKQEINSPVLLFIIGIVVGAIGISLGIGGAIFLTPILVGFLNVDIKKAMSMSLFFVVFSSLSGLASMAFNNLINYKIGIPLGIASLLGAYFGTILSQKINPNLQKKLLLYLYIVMFLIVLSELKDHF